MRGSHGHTRSPHFLKVLYLAPFPPSLTYRPWAAGARGFAPLRWLLERLSRRWPGQTLLVACQDEADRQRAEALAGGLDVFVTRCSGQTPLEALGELALIFPAAPLAYFHLEMMFAPSGLLERVCNHHQQQGNDFTYVSGVPPLMCPEVIHPALLAMLARIDSGRMALSPRQAVLTLAALRAASGNGRPIRAEPFPAADFYSLPPLAHMRRLTTEDAVDRARQILQDLPEEYAFEAVERWSRTSFTPPDPGWQPEPGDTGRPHILYVSPSSLYSGAEECLRGLAAHLSFSGLRQTAIIGAEGVLSARLREAGCRVLAANWDFASSQAGSAGETEDAARTFADTALAAIRPTCIHCNSDPGRCFTTAARELGIPLVAHVRTATLAGMEEWLAGSSHVIAVSEFAAKRLIEAGTPAEKITVVYDGVDSVRFAPGRFDRAEGRHRLALPEAAFVVLMVARPTPQKRHDLMLDAFADLCATHPGAHLVFVPDFGDARFVAAMRAKTAALGLEQQVHWLPFQEEIGAVECACDTVVLPSDGDALGTCILEAMSLQLPVVVSDSGGAHELIEDQVSGLRFAGGDRAGLAATLRGLAADPEWRRHLGRNARLRVEQRFELRHHALQVAEVFARLSQATY